MPIMTSHLCAASRVEAKTLDTPARSTRMLCGSAQTLSTLGSTSSIDQSERPTACASSLPHRNVPAIAAAETHKLTRSHLPSAELVIDLFSSNFGVSARGAPLWCSVAL